MILFGVVIQSLVNPQKEEIMTIFVMIIRRSKDEIYERKSRRGKV